MKNDTIQNKSEIFAVVRNKYDELSKSHKKIAQFMLKNYEKVADMSAVQVAEAVGISEATVVRFAMFLGFDGYIEFRKTLKEYLSRKLTTIERINNTTDVDSNQSVPVNETIVKNAFKKDMRAIRDTFENFDIETFEACVNILLNARRVLIVGFRSVSFLADYLSYYLSILLDDVRLINQKVNNYYGNLVKTDERDVVLAISFPRYSQSALEAVEYAKEKKAKIIVISDNAHAPLNQFADHILLAKSNGFSFVDSFVAPMSLINALIVAVGSKNVNITKNNFKELEEIWKRHDVYAGDEIFQDLP